MQRLCRRLGKHLDPHDAMRGGHVQVAVTCYHHVRYKYPARDDRSEVLPRRRENDHTTGAGGEDIPSLVDLNAIGQSHRVYLRWRCSGKDGIDAEENNAERYRVSPMVSWCGR